MAPQLDARASRGRRKELECRLSQDTDCASHASPPETRPCGLSHRESAETTRPLPEQQRTPAGHSTLGCLMLLSVADGLQQHAWETLQRCWNSLSLLLNAPKSTKQLDAEIASEAEAVSREGN